MNRKVTDADGKVYPLFEKVCARCGSPFEGRAITKRCPKCPRYEPRHNARDFVCKECGDTFQHAGSGSPGYCKKHSAISKRKATARDCVQCGNSFRPGYTRKEAKLCSRYCQGLWINANGLGPKYNDVELRAKLIASIKALVLPLTSHEVLERAGVAHKTLTSRGWLMSDLYKEAGVVMPPKNRSKFEARVYAALLMIFDPVQVETQKDFDDLRSEKGAHMWFDFWIPLHNLIIEADGPQHYDYKGFFDSTERNDATKNAYCEKQGIRLLRIRYSRQLSCIAIKKEIIKFIAPGRSDVTSKSLKLSGTVAQASQSAAKPAMPEGPTTIPSGSRVT